MPTAVHVDPARHPYDPAPARLLAEKHTLWAVDGVRRRNAPLGGRARETVESFIDRDLIGHHGGVGGRLAMGGQRARPRRRSAAGAAPVTCCCAGTTPAPTPHDRGVG